jgi:hypothetical protein
MALPWREHDLEHLREVADRISAMIAADTDRRTALGRVARAVEQRGAMADLLIDYAGRWFKESNGQSLLIGPELYWLLTESDDEPQADRGAAKRARGMLLLCVFDGLSRQRPQDSALGGNREIVTEFTPLPTNGAANGVTPALNSQIVVSQPG